MLAAPVVILCVTLFSLGLGYLLSVAYVFFADIKYLYSVLLSLWMYCSAIFYPVEQLQGVIRVVIWNNPLYTFIHCMRKAVMMGALPERIEWFQMLFWSLGVYAIGSLIFQKNRNRIMQKL